MEYGVISMDMIHAHVNTYIGQQNHQAQNSMMMAVFLLKSLAKDLKKTITNKDHQFKINGHGQGALLLKLIILEVRTDTQYSMQALHDTLKDIAKIMMDQGHNIKKVNQVMEDTIESIHARGAVPSTDLLSKHKDPDNNYSLCSFAI